MRAVLLVTAAAVVLAPLAAAQAAPAAKQDRVVSFEYTGLVAAHNDRLSFETGCPEAVFVPRMGRLASCGRFDTAKGERSLHLTAKDDVGLPVGLAVRLGGTRTRFFCGSVTLPLPSKAPVQVAVGAVSTASCPAAARGTVTATLSRRPAAG